MANGNGDGEQAFGDGPTAFRNGGSAYGPVSTPSVSLPSASTYQTQVPTELGMLDPSYPAQRDARLAELAQRESGNQNLRNPASTAGGYWQTTNPTWRAGANLAGVDTRRYPTAQRASYGTQQQVARALYDQYGETPWQQTVRSSPVAVASSALDPWTRR